MTIYVKIVMNDEQNAAYLKILEFIESKENFFGLFGFAGTGKSFLTSHIAKLCGEVNIKICGISPTHKAKKVLENYLNRETFLPIPAITVAKFLTKKRVHSYTGTKNFRGNNRDTSSSYDLFIIDECSMICDRDVENIKDAVKRFDKKAIFIGDPCQIPNPVQKFEWNDDGTISKKDSSSFDVEHVMLKNIVRQENATSIVDISKLFREDILTEKEIPRKNTKDIKFYNNSRKFWNALERFISKENYLRTRLVTYTNNSVRAYNIFIRNILGFEEKFVVGDLLMGYLNIGFPVPFIENGEEYVVKETEIVEQKIDQFKCKGHRVVIEPRHSHGNVTLFFPFLTGDGNVKMLKKLKGLAQKVNMSGSTIDDYKRYKNLKNQVMFLENIYEYGGEIVNEQILKDKHPKLFKNVSNYIDAKTRKIIANDKTHEYFKEKYSNLLDKRVDDDKQITENEKFVDRFLIIDMDMSYGYAHTCHKSQGSTYENVFVDEKNFEKLQDCWNNRYGAFVNSTKEKNQLKYVAYTRASHKMWVLHI